MPEHGYNLTRHATVVEDNVALPKKLIVCCDGTWCDSDNTAANPTNVTRIARAISCEDDNHHPQIVYYQAGIGTGIGLVNHLLGGSVGVGLAENIREAYSFLALNYRQKDQIVQADSIFLIGFSRGAFTARSIAGLISAFGILTRKALPHFYDAFSDWEMAGNPKYTPKFFDTYYAHHRDLKPKKPSLALARDRSQISAYLDEYRRILESYDLTQPAKTQCVGVWDTVGSLGIPVNPILQHYFPFLPPYLREYSFFDTGLDNTIKNAFQALGLDEHRYPFSPSVWEKPDGCTTNLKQCWFPGAHSNIGGSYDDPGMSDITLAWMMDQLAGNTTHHSDGKKKPVEWIKFDDRYIDFWNYCETDWYHEHRNEKAYQGWAMGHVYDSKTFPQSMLGGTIRRPGLFHRTSYPRGNAIKNSLLVNTNEHIHSSVRARMDLAGHGIEPDWKQVFPKGLSIAPLIRSYLGWIIGWRPTPYHPQRAKGPLHDWTLIDGHKSHERPNMDIAMDPPSHSKGGDEIIWKYEGASGWKNKHCTADVSRLRALYQFFVPPKGPACECVQPGLEMPEDRLGPFEMQLLEKDRELAGKIEFTNNRWRWRKHPHSQHNHNHRHHKHAETWHCGDDDAVAAHR